MRTVLTSGIVSKVRDPGSCCRTHNAYLMTPSIALPRVVLMAHKVRIEIRWLFLLQSDAGFGIVGECTDDLPHLRAVLERDLFGECKIDDVGDGAACAAPILVVTEWVTLRGWHVWFIDDPCCEIEDSGPGDGFSFFDGGTETVEIGAHVGRAEGA